MFSRLIAFLHINESIPSPHTAGTDLHSLAVGQSAEVLELVGEGEVLARLQALGLCKGRVLRLLQKGDPMIVEVLGARLGISGRLGHHVRLRIR